MGISGPGQDKNIRFRLQGLRNKPMIQLIQILRAAFDDGFDVKSRGHSHTQNFLYDDAYPEEGLTCPRLKT